MKIQIKLFILILILFSHAQTYSFSVLAKVRAVFTLLPHAQAKSNNDRDQDQDKDIEKIGKSRKQREAKAEKERRKKSKRKGNQPDETTALDLMAEDIPLLRKVIEKQIRIIVTRKLQAVGVAKSRADDIASRIITLAAQAAQLKKMTDYEIEQIETRREELEKIKDRSFQETKELEQLNQKYKKLIETKQKKEDAFGIALAGVGEVMSAQLAGNKTELAFDALCVALEGAGLEYGHILGSLLKEIWQNGAQLFTEANYDGCLRKTIEYYEINHSKEVGGWLLGFEKSTGKVYIRLDYPCDQLAGHVYVEHRELVLKERFRYPQVEELIEQILDGEYMLGEYVCKLLPKNLKTNLFG